MYKHSKHLTIKLSLFILLFSSVKGQAQTCDENILKGLEQTRIYYYKEVTKGSNASFFVKNPLKGTTYSFIDKATGVAYTKQYTGVPEELTVEIPVGKVDVIREFYFKAENGNCTFYQPNMFSQRRSILPDTSKNPQPKISYSVEEEWCTNAGAIHLAIVNDNTTDYKFYAKKDNGAFVELSQPDYTSLSSGRYTVKAQHRATGKTLKEVTVNLKSFVKPVKFLLKTVPEACSGKQAIYVDINKDENNRNVTNNLPLFFTLYDSNDAVVRPAQLSPVFTNLEAGIYKVRVNDNCGTGTGGNALTQQINLLATLSTLDIESINGFTAKSGCPYMTDFKVSFIAKNIENILKADVLTYPIEFDLQILSPSNKVYPIRIILNNKQEFTEYFWASGDVLNLISQKVVQNRIPAEAGKWKVKGTYTLCGQERTLAEKESLVVSSPLDYFYITETVQKDVVGCRNKAMTLNFANNDNPNALRNYYVVLEEAPAGFDYVAAGFYKVNSTNPNLKDKWVKFFPDIKQQVLLNPEFITEDFNYKFKLVDDECSGQTKDLSRPGYKLMANLAVDAKAYVSCTDNNGTVNTNGAWKDVVFKKRDLNSSLSKVEILSYTKNSAFADYKSLVPVTLPFTLTDTYKTGAEQWGIKLPSGDYKVRYTDACGQTAESKLEVRGPDNTLLKWEEQNCQTTVSVVRSTTAYYAPQGIAYVIEIYNPEKRIWEPFKTSGNVKTVLTLDNTNKQKVTFPQGGKFRVIRAISRDGGATIECPQVIEEREIAKGEMRQPKIARLDCSAIGGAQKYHIVITPQGGTPPYSYMLKSKEETQTIGGVTSVVTTIIEKTNGDNNFFINIDESNAMARYKFVVKDACNVEKSIDETLSNIQPFKIEKNQQYYCLNAKGIVSLPKIEGLTYAWYRKDNPVTILSTDHQLVIDHLTQDDLDKEFAVKLTLTNVTDPLVKNCIESNLNGMSSIRFNAIPTLSQTYQAPTAKNSTACIVPNGNETEYNVNVLFSNQPTTLETGVYTEVVDKAGIISVAKDGSIKLSGDTIGKHTFVYSIITDCGVVTQTEAILDVRGYRSFGDFQTEVCAPTVTFSELQKLGQKAYPAWFMLATPEQYIFEWYLTLADANARTNKITSASVSLNEGETKQYYVRIRINDEKSCFFPNPSSFKVTRIGNTAKPNKTVTLCEGTTVGELKDSIDKPNRAKIAIYNGTQKLTDDYVLQNGINYTYTYLVGVCETAPANITLTLSERTKAAIETLVTCESQQGYQGAYAPQKVVEDAIKAKYGATTIVKIYQDRVNGALNNGQIVLGSDNYTYTIEAPGKCVSLAYPVKVYEDISLKNFIVTQTTQSFCSNTTVANLQPQGTNIVWYATVTSTTPLASTTPLVAGTYYVAQKNGSCESVRVAVNVVFSNTLSVTVPSTLTIACNETNANTTVTNWLSQATVTDTCGTATLTHDYAVVKPTDWCNTPNGGVVTVTFVGKDPLGNTVTKTSTIKVLSIDAVDDTYTSTINGATGATDVIDVLQNDRVGGVSATTANITLTVVTPATGGTNVPTLNTTTGKISVPAGTKSGTYTIQYKICHTENNVTVCDTATATVKVGSTPIVATPDTYTITNGSSTTTTTSTVLDNDKLGTKTPTTTDVILTVVTTTTDVVGTTHTPTLDNNGKVVVPSGTKSGTYQIIYSICERLNPDNCATTTATVKVGSTPIVATPDTYTITNGSSTTTTTGTVLDNDKLGTKTPTTTDVILTVVTTTTDVVGATHTPTLVSNGKVVVPSGTKSGTYQIVYSICERLNPNNCATATATVKVFVPAVVTPTTIEANNDGVITITQTVGGTTTSVLANDKLNGVLNPSVSSVTLAWTTATPTGFTLNSNGTINVAPNTAVGSYTIGYTICAVASSTVCDSAVITVVVTATTTNTTTPTTPVLPIAVDDHTTTPLNTPVVVNVLSNDTPNGATTPNVVTSPVNGTVIVNLDGSIEYRPHTNFEGTDSFVYQLCNADGCATATVAIDVVSKVVPYNAISVDGNGKNDHFHIAGIEHYPNNVVRIYNRWGVKVFETEGYDNLTRVFRGISNGRVTVEQADKLPQGTYYYVIEYYDSNNNKESLVGWLYIKK
ncbi:hypothetical protein RCZ04_11720 [Capnocytophaga sp. HP1101]